MKYVAQFPDKRVLVNAMRSSLPQRIGDEAYAFEVDNEGQAEIIKESLMHLITYLRNELHNEKITINVTLRKSGPRPKVWTDREVVENMKKNNPDFVQMISDFGLTMA